MAKRASKEENKEYRPVKEALVKQLVDLEVVHEKEVEIRTVPKKEGQPKPAARQITPLDMADALTKPTVSITTRFTPVVAKALKREVLERKIAGTMPDTLQGILQEAAIRWLQEEGGQDPTT